VNVEFAADKETHGRRETRVFLQHLWRLFLNDECTAHMYDIIRYNTQVLIKH